MFRNQQSAGAGPLQSLIAQAADYAEYAMRKFGRIPPTLLAETAEGLVVYLPESMGDERAKDNFANTARLVAAAYAPTAVVLILESWMTMARPGEPSVPMVPPSQSPDRQEVVVIQAEGADARSAVLLRIQRRGNGKFSGFGTADVPEFDEMSGRFAGLFPPKPPTPENQKIARQLLAMIGVVPKNMGFNPMWN